MPESAGARRLKKALIKGGLEGVCPKYFLNYFHQIELAFRSFAKDSLCGNYCFQMIVDFPAFAYPDVISWLESKISGVHVQDVIREKFLRGKKGPERETGKTV